MAGHPGHGLPVSTEPMDEHVPVKDAQSPTMKENQAHVYYTQRFHSLSVSLLNPNSETATKASEARAAWCRGTELGSLVGV